MCRTDFRLESIEYYREVLNALKITKKLDQTTLSQFKKILEQGGILFLNVSLTLFEYKSRGLMKYSFLNIS